MFLKKQIGKGKVIHFFHLGWKDNPDLHYVCTCERDDILSVIRALKRNNRNYNPVYVFSFESETPTFALNKIYESFHFKCMKIDDQIVSTKKYFSGVYMHIIKRDIKIISKEKFICNIQRKSNLERKRRIGKNKEKLLRKSSQVCD